MKTIELGELSHYRHTVRQPTTSVVDFATISTNGTEVFLKFEAAVVETSVSAFFIDPSFDNFGDCSLLAVV